MAALNLIKQAMIALILSLVLGQSSVGNPTSSMSQIPLEQIIYSKEKVGALAWSILQSPDKVTVQAVDPTGMPTKRDIGESKFGPAYPVFGPERHLTETQTKNVVIDLARPVFRIDKACTFSPDHVFVFTKGQDQIELVTCFRCGDMISMLNGKGLAGGPLTPTVASVIYESFTLEEASFAALMARVSKTCFELLVSANSAVAFRIDESESVDPWKSSAQHRIKGSIDAKTCQRILEYLALDAYSDWRKLGHRMELPRKDFSILIQFDTNPRLEMLCRTKVDLVQFRLNGQQFDSRLFIGNNCAKIPKLVGF